ncbi:MAG: phasin family protein [Rhodocyclaceae bacterium]|nr:phasin family protein [Rhodocyclaceae bacterium]
MKNEQLSELHRKNLEAAMRLAQLSIENSQKIMALQSELARELFQESVANAKAQTGAQDPQEIMGLRTKYAQETAQKMMESAQKIAEIGNEARVEFSRLLTEQLASGSHDLMDSFQTFFKALPGQNPNVIEAMQQAMARANSAFEQISQVSSTAFGNMNELAKKSTPAPKAKSK